MTDTLPPVMSGGRWNTNGELLADVARLYIRPTDRVIDVTFGRGLWWTEYQHPTELFIGCVEKVSQIEALIDHPLGGSVRILPDYRDMRAGTNDYAEQFDVALFDPPYVSKGGRSTSGIPEMDDRYGLKEAAKDPWSLHLYNLAGVAELVKIVRPRGLIMVKCMDYISSGRLQPGTHWMIDGCWHEFGLELHDRFRMVAGAGPQPKTDKCRACEGTGDEGGGGVPPTEDEAFEGRTDRMCSECLGSGVTPRRQVHARQNVSELLVFRTPRRAPRKVRSAA